MQIKCLLTAQCFWVDSQGTIRAREGTCQGIGGCWVRDAVQSKSVGSLKGWNETYESRNSKELLASFHRIVGMTVQFFVCFFNFWKVFPLLCR